MMIELFNHHICNFLDQQSGFDEDDIQAIKSKYKTEKKNIRKKKKI